MAVAAATLVWAAHRLLERYEAQAQPEEAQAGEERSLRGLQNGSVSRAHARVAARQARTTQRIRRAAAASPLALRVPYMGWLRRIHCERELPSPTKASFILLNYNSRRQIELPTV